MLDSTKPTPTITLPLPLFLQILWGYKKPTELRDRAVPGQEIVDIIQGIDGHESYLYIQTQEGCATAIWQLSEWRSSGEKQMLLKERSAKCNHNVDTIEAALLKSKLAAVMDKSSIRQLAHNLQATGDFKSLEMFGIKEEDLKI